MEGIKREGQRPIIANFYNFYHIETYIMKGATEPVYLYTTKRERALGALNETLLLVDPHNYFLKRKKLLLRKIDHDFSKC